MTVKKTDCILDFDSLLKPVDGESPAGKYLRYEGLYDRIEEFRKEDDPNLPQGVWQTEIKSADWQSVYETTAAAIASQSKDLQLAGWLLESLILLHGTSGLNQGVLLIYELCKGYWDTLHPAIDDDDTEFRAAPFLWINRVLSERIKGIPITFPEGDGGESFSFCEWEKMIHLETLAKQSATARKKLNSESKYTRGVFNRSVDHTPVNLLQNSRNALQASLSTTEELGVLLDEKCGKASPSLELFKKAMKAILTQLNLLIGKQESTENHLVEPEAAALEKPGRSVLAAVSLDAASHIANREEAYHTLSEIAEYLMETDPHSPVPFLVKRAVNWGAMSLSELLTELLKDGQNLQQIYSLLGIHE